MATRKQNKATPANAANAGKNDEVENRVLNNAAVPEGVEADTAGFPIVGIGASAGGLAAFESFFSGMPADTDPEMAFILVQHLAPDHKSILADLVRRYTRLQVFEVEDGVVVQPNCVYIIPPNRDMAFLGGALHLLEPAFPRGQRLPIDFFFRSLAQDQHDRAIGIVLSGTGSDGTLGIRAIKGEGGMVMVQTSDSTEFDGMPRSAIATGVVDFILPPAEMPAQLIAYASHAFGHALRRHFPSPPPKSENALKKIYILLRNQTGNDFSQYKPSTINRRIERRMALQQIETMEHYVKYAQQTPKEVDALFRDLLIGVTNFFRDPHTFKALEEKIVPQLFAGKTPGATIRVWTPGCATGEEAYSLAILLAEYQHASKRNYKIQVFATDIDSQAIAAARAGLYPASIAADISPERLARFFSLESDGTTYRIHKVIRDMLIFSEQNVIKDPPFSRLDLISCRNLLIYMGGDLQKKLIPLFYYALNPSGFLFLGTSETVGDFTDLFSLQDRKSKLYQRKDTLQGALRMGLGTFLPLLPTMYAERPQQTAGMMVSSQKITLRQLTEKELLQHVAPAAALINSQGDLFYIHGRTGLYLEPAVGEVGVSNILKMAREGLRPQLSEALREAVRAQKTVRCPAVQVKTNGGYTPVNLTVRPVTSGTATMTEPSMYLVILEDIDIPLSGHESASSAEPGIPSALTTDSDTDSCLIALRQELQSKGEFLQTANEEMRSSNEEMQSINEELQSTNEELETSKEELQSVNEELATVNAELQNKISDLTRTNNDMNNLLAGTGIGTVFVDHALRILRFTPAATRIINLIQSDIGRPVGHIVSNLAGYDSLLKDTQAVLDTLVPKEVEVHTQTGMWYAMRILPYRTLDNVIEGAVLTFSDITESKRLQAALSQAHTHLAEAVVATVREPLLVLDGKLRVVSANRAFYTTFNVTPDATVGTLMYDLGNSQWDIPALRTLLEDILSRNIEFNDFEVTHEFASIGWRSLRLNARRLFDEAGESELILLAIEVTTDSSLHKPSGSSAGEPSPHT